MLMENTAVSRVVCVHRPPVTDEWAGFAFYMSNLLNSRLEIRSLQPPHDQQAGFMGHPSSSRLWESGNIDEAIGEVHHPGDYSIWRATTPDLIIYGESRPAWWRRALRRVEVNHVLKHANTSVLITRRPRAPLRRILWIIRDHESDDSTLRWIRQLAVPSEAEVTLMPVIPAYGRLYRRGDPAQFPMDIFMDEFDSILSGYVSWLNTMNVSGSIKRRQGSPMEQIRAENRSGDHDLIVLADEPNNRWERWFLGELVSPLLRSADRPVLIAR